MKYYSIKFDYCDIFPFPKFINIENKNRQDLGYENFNFKDVKINPIGVDIKYLKDIMFDNEIGNCCIVHERVRAILEKTKKTNILFHSIDLYTGDESMDDRVNFKKTTDIYFYMQILENTDILQLVDFKNSSFFLMEDGKNWENSTEMHITTFEDLLEKNKNIDWRFLIVADKLKIRSKIDMDEILYVTKYFSFYWTRPICFSKRLLKILIENKITGIESFKECILV